MSDTPLPPDRDLVTRLRAGDETAYDAIVRHYYKGLLTYILTAVRSVGTGEDLLQDLFLHLWRQRAALPPDVNLRIYLYAAARNHVLDHHRAERRRAAAYDRLVQETDPGGAETPEWDTLSLLARDELAAAVRHAAAQLPARCREIWMLSREQGLSYAEIAQVTGVSINTVKTQMGRAMTALREAMRPFMD